MFKTILNQLGYEIAAKAYKVIKTTTKLLGELLLLILTPIPYILMTVEALITIPIVKAYRYYKSLIKTTKLN